MLQNQQWLAKKPEIREKYTNKLKPSQIEFGPAQSTFVRTAVIIGLLIVLLTSGLFLYTCRIYK